MEQKNNARIANLEGFNSLFLEKKNGMVEVHEISLEFYENDNFNVIDNATQSHIMRRSQRYGNVFAKQLQSVNTLQKLNEESQVKPTQQTTLFQFHQVEKKTPK